MIPKLSEATIRRYAIAQSFDRGQADYRSGSVYSLIQRGHTLSARVEGSEVAPYQVNIQFDPGGITQATCSCPYDFEGWCKHVVATLLACLYQPGQIEQRSDLATQLTPLNREQLQLILQNLAQDQPGWIEAIEYQIALLKPSNSTTPKKATRRTSVDPKTIERQVERIIDRSSEQWNDEPALDEIREIVQKADAFLEEGDGNNGLIILGAVIRAYVQNWMNLDGSSGGSGDFFTELDDALTEAILSAELSASDRQQWQKDLKTWQKEISDYGIESFAMSLTALEQGWDYAPLQRVLQGGITGRGAWEDEPPNFADDLAQIRLTILARQGRDEEYLFLAQAEGQTERYLQMLAKLGRIEEAIAEAQEQMVTVDEAWTLAQTLREQGELEHALNVAIQGLTLDGYNHYRVAIWASALAEGFNPDIAFQTRLTAFKLQPSLPDYLKLKEMVGDRWSSLQPELLTTLRQYIGYQSNRAKAAIFVEEGLIADAIATVDRLGSQESDIIHPVMDAAMPHRPDWVLENARRRAESIMNNGKAKYYEHAVNWLRKVRAAHLQLGQQQEWQRYRAELMQTHVRKSKLINMLKEQDLM